MLVLHCVLSPVGVCCLTGSRPETVSILQPLECDCEELVITSETEGREQPEPKTEAWN